MGEFEPGRPSADDDEVTGAPVAEAGEETVELAAKGGDRLDDQGMFRSACDRRHIRHDPDVEGEEIVGNGRMTLDDHLTQAAVKGSGAGMEPGPGGHFENGWWVWAPKLPPVPSLVLAASSKTPSAWRLCAEQCVDLGATSGQPV